MNRWAILLVFFVFSATAASAMGFTEDPSEVLTKTWAPGTLRTLEIRGEIEVELKKAPTTRITVTASRALFDQLSVSNWWGWATVAIETGLRGPRERGKVLVTIELAELEELSVSEHSLVFGVWPSSVGTIKVSDGSSAKLVLQSDSFVVQVLWKAAVSLSGETGQLRVEARHEAQVDLRDCRVGSASVELDNQSSYLAGPTQTGIARARHGSRVELPATTSEQTWAVTQSPP